MAATDIPDDAPAPRLAHLIKWPDFDGYGFNLHAEKSKVGQYIGKVDKDSPAELAGLRQGDRIIEVNGVNIANENHRQVVERIKQLPNETKMLVLDEESDRYYKEKKIVVKSTQKNVQYAKTPTPHPGSSIRPTTNGPSGSDSGASSPASGSVAGSTAESETPVQAIPSEKESKMEELPAHLRPRLCHLVKWPDFEGYGFNIHADKTKNGHIIGKVDPESPAETAGLRQGDRIIEVNEQNVTSQTHKQVVEYIKMVSNETRLLVLSEDAEKHCQDKNIIVTTKDKNVVYIKTPPRPSPSSPSQNGPQSPTTPTGQQTPTTPTGQHTPTTPTKTKQPSTPTKTASPVNSLQAEGTSKVMTRTSPKASPQPSPRPESQHEIKPSPKSSSRPASEHTDNGLNLNISAAEMRQIIAQRKKEDPKKKQMDLKKKFQMVQNM